MRQLKYNEFEYVKRWPMGHFNPHSNIVIKRNGVELECGFGSNDSVSVWESADTVYVLSINRSLGYVGCSCYDLRLLEPGAALAESTSVFLQADHDIESALGKRGLNLTERTILRRLQEYLY